MAILKGVTVDKFKDVTVLILEKIAFREKKVGNSVHVIIYEGYEKEDMLIQLNDKDGICMSSDAHNIDIIIDIPNETSLDQFIIYLQELKQRMYHTS